MISVIIPTYNRITSTMRAIDSVLNQSYQNKEIIVVDDFSNDDTVKILLQKYAGQINLIKQKQHQGVSAARNRGVLTSQGEWIAFLDSDDVWLPDKLIKQINFFKTFPDFQICQTQEIWIRSGQRVNPRKKHQKLFGDLYQASLDACMISPSSVMFSRNLFDQMNGFDEDLFACEDYDLWLQITCKYLVGLVNENLLIKYGGHPDQLSRKYQAMDRFRLYSLVKILRSGVLTKIQYQQTIEKIITKKSVLINGGIKRGKNLFLLNNIFNKVIQGIANEADFLTLKKYLLARTWG